MRFTKVLSLLVVISLAVPPSALAAMGPSPDDVASSVVNSPAASQSAQDERAERERKKAADRAAKQAAEQSKDYQETMKEVAADLDEAGAELLKHEYKDPFLQDYVNELGQSLVPKETSSDTLFSFRVIDNAEPNAFALPDGRIYINTGLLLFVENEAQLAMVLGHEIGHVLEHHYVEAVRSQKRDAIIGSVIGVAGGILGGIFGGKKGGADGATVGAAIGVAAGFIVAQLRMNNYSRKQEDEADSVGATLLLDNRFDPREGAVLFKRLSDAYGDHGRFANALYGKHSRNVDRAAYIEQLVTGNLSAEYNQARTAGSLTVGSGQMKLYTSRMVRDVAITLMDTFDQYRVAKDHLEQISDYRASDPLTLWALGRVYKRIGRTDQDRSRALDFLQRAVQLDERNLYPFLHFDLGLMQARLGSTPAAVESLKKYVVNYVTRYHRYPDDLESTYDYLLTFGDRNWTAPAIDPAVVRATSGASPSNVGSPASVPAAAKQAQPDPKRAGPVKTPTKATGRGGRGGGGGF